MEPITTGLLAGFLWNNFGQPLLDKAKQDYAEKVFNNIKGFMTELPFEKEENEIIEAEIIEAIETQEVVNKKTFIKFIEDNNNFNLALQNLQEVKKDVEIINSFKSLSNAKIKVRGESKLIKDSFENINDSEIEI